MAVIEGEEWIARQAMEGAASLLGSRASLGRDCIVVRAGGFILQSGLETGDALRRSSDVQRPAERCIFVTGSLG